MEFKRRNAEYPNRFKLIPTSDPEIFDLEKVDDGVKVEEGTCIDEELFEKINGREDSTLEFLPCRESDLTAKKSGRTRIYCSDNNEIRVEPSAGNIFTLADKKSVETIRAQLDERVTGLSNTKLETSNIIAGSNISISRNGRNLTINSTNANGSFPGSGNIGRSVVWTDENTNLEVYTVTMDMLGCASAFFELDGIAYISSLDTYQPFKIMIGTFDGIVQAAANITASTLAEPTQKIEILPMITNTGSDFFEFRLHALKRDIYDNAVLEEADSGIIIGYLCIRAII